MKRALWWVGLGVQAVFYAAAGVNHFVHSKMYVSIMPPHYSDPLFWVHATGVAEILGGIGLLIPATRKAAAWGIVAMLIGYFDVHVWMAMHPERFANIPAWALYGRLPLQFLLIAWAWVYTRPQRARA